MDRQGQRPGAAIPDAAPASTWFESELRTGSSGIGSRVPKGLPASSLPAAAHSPPPLARALVRRLALSKGSSSL